MFESGNLQAERGKKMDSVIETVSERLEREVAILCDKADAPGAAVGIVRDGKLAWSHGYGFKNLDSEEAPGGDTLFRVASITKTFTGTAIYQLRDRGLLELDDPLVRHIPEFAGAVPRKGDLEEVTLRRMLCHHSGLMSYAPTDGRYWNTYVWPSMAEILNVIPEIEVSIEPDSAFKYSNLAFGLLGEVIGRVSGRPYEEFVIAELLEPLGMESTTFEPEGDLKARTATGYQGKPFEEFPDSTPYPSLAGQVAAGQLYSTVEDLARWLIFHLGPGTDEEPESSVLSTRSLKEMQRPLFMDEDWSAGYGTPWGMHREKSDIVRGHGGAVHGFGSEISFIATRRLGVIVLLNRMTGARELSSKIFETVIEAEEANQLLEPKKKPSQTPLELVEYLGLYHGAFGGMGLKVEYRDGSLQIVILEAPTVDPAVLEKTDEPDIFRGTNGRLAGARIVFGRSASGRVSNLVAEAMQFRKLDEVPD